jgi:hypothetical protein
MRAPTPDEIALALKAPITPREVGVRWNAATQRASAAEPATMEPPSM